MQCSVGKSYLPTRLPCINMSQLCCSQGLTSWTYEPISSTTMPPFCILGFALQCTSPVGSVLLEAGAGTVCGCCAKVCTEAFFLLYKTI